MFTSPILADEAKLPLDKAGFAGVVAVIRPIDVVDASKWRDAFPTDNARNAASTELVRQQLIRIENFALRAPDGSTVPYDHSNVKHFRSIPLTMRTAIYVGLMENVSISGDQEVKSDSPSDSGGTSGMESSPAEAAASEPGTS